MVDVSHTHPHGDTEPGTVMFSRGRQVATDGGEKPGRETEGRTMRDVDHTPPSGEGTNRVWERGRTPVRDDDA